MSLKSPHPITPDLAGLDDQVRRMSGTLSCDFAAGHVGQRHNTYQHRARLLRQLTARRDQVRQAMTGSVLAL